MDLPEFYYIISEFVRIVAEKLGIPKCRSLDYTRDLIKDADAVASERLEAFLNAYWQWADFHRRVEAKQLAGTLTEDENGQLVHLAAQRDRTREALKQHLQELGG